MVVVENATVDYPIGAAPTGLCAWDTDDNLAGLTKLANTHKRAGRRRLSSDQPRPGRFSGMAEPALHLRSTNLRPHAQGSDQGRDAGHRPEIRRKAALRVKKAGFDMVELHGGTWISSFIFVSPRTNKRDDEYGGVAENRQRFPLEVRAKGQGTVGNFPVGTGSWRTNGCRTA